MKVMEGENKQHIQGKNPSNIFLFPGVCLILKFFGSDFFEDLDRWSHS